MSYYPWSENAAIPAVRIPVDKPIRQVGISHSNNSGSLVDHSSAAQTIHHSMRVVSQNVAAILSDNQYYKAQELKREFQLLENDVKEMARDTSYEETRDTYHHHFWKADVESEDKYLITKLSEIAYAFVDYKGNCCIASRGQQSLDGHYLQRMCNKHLDEIRNYRRELAPYVNQARAQSNSVSKLAAPLESRLPWKPGMSPLDDPDVRRILPHECTLTTRETIRPRTEPPVVNGHVSGVFIMPSAKDVPDYSGRPGAMNSGTSATLSPMGRYGGRHIYEANINDRRRPQELPVQGVSRRYKHTHGFCE